MRQAMAARSGTASSARRQGVRRGELGVVVEREEHPAGTERGGAVPPEPHQGGVRRALHGGLEDRQVLGFAPLVGDPDVLGNAELRAGGGDGLLRLRRTSMARVMTSASYPPGGAGAEGAPARCCGGGYWGRLMGAGSCPASELQRIGVKGRARDGQVGDALHLLAAAGDGVEDEAAHEATGRRAASARWRAPRSAAAAPARSEVLDEDRQREQADHGQQQRQPDHAEEDQRPLVAASGA